MIFCIWTDGNNTSEGCLETRKVLLDLLRAVVEVECYELMLDCSFELCEHLSGPGVQVLAGLMDMMLLKFPGIEEELELPELAGFNPSVCDWILTEFSWLDIHSLKAETRLDAEKVVRIDSERYPHGFGVSLAQRILLNGDPK